jgi:hypothetical protein
MSGRRAPAPLVALAVVVLGLAAPAAGLRAQTPPPAVGLPAPADFIPLLDDSTHREAGEAARAAQLRAEDDLAVAREREADAKARLNSRRTTLEGLKKQIDLANKDKREADKKALEAERKNEELARNFFERLLALREAEVEGGKASVEAFRAAVTMHNRAVELLNERRKFDDVRSVTSSAQLSNRESGLASSEKLYLEATRTWAEKAAESASKEKTIAERRLSAWESLRQVRR